PRTSDLRGLTILMTITPPYGGPAPKTVRNQFLNFKHAVNPLNMEFGNIRKHTGRGVEPLESAGASTCRLTTFWKHLRQKTMKFVAMPRLYSGAKHYTMVERSSIPKIPCITRKPTRRPMAVRIIPIKTSEICA